MATGDQNDLQSRLLSYLPRGWFPSVSPVLSAVLSGIAAAFAPIYAALAYAKLQTRIATATDGWLDMVANDYFGATLVRKSGQADAALRAAILAALLRQKATRFGLSQVLTQLTGYAPIILEPQRPTDTGVYGGGYCGYGVAGIYGSQLIPYQCFVIAYRPQLNGPYNVAGYGSSYGAYTTPSFAEYLPSAQAYGALGDADIYAAVDATRAAGTQVWVCIQTYQFGARLDLSLALDSSTI